MMFLRFKYDTYDLYHFPNVNIFLINSGKTNVRFYFHDVKEFDTTEYFWLPTKL